MKYIDLLLRSSKNSVDLVDMEFFLAEEEPLPVAEVQESPDVGLVSPEDFLFDYPDIKLEELDTDTIMGDLEVDQFIEVYYDVLPSLGPKIEIFDTVS